MEHQENFNPSELKGIEMIQVTSEEEDFNFVGEIRNHFSNNSILVEDANSNIYLLGWDGTSWKNIGEDFPESYPGLSISIFPIPSED